MWAVFVAFRLCRRVLWGLGDLLCVWAGSEGELRNLAFARGLGDLIPFHVTRQVPNLDSTFHLI